MDAWNLRSPYSAIGIYISGNSRYCGDEYQPNLSKTWVETNASHGWRFIPIHVGYQSPCFRNNPSSRVQKKRMSSTVSTARSQAASDAAEGIAALKKYGFGSGDVHYLDLEWYVPHDDVRPTPCSSSSTSGPRSSTTPASSPASTPAVPRPSPSWTPRRRPAAP